jgi:flagellar biosynthetic protein FliR
VEVSIALLSKLSPQLPVLALTVPAKTILGYVVLIASLSIWARIFANRFTLLLDSAQVVVARTFAGPAR